MFPESLISPFSRSDTLVRNDFVNSWKDCRASFNSLPQNVRNTNVYPTTRFSMRVKPFNVPM